MKATDGFLFGINFFFGIVMAIAILSIVLGHWEIPFFAIDLGSQVVP